MVISTYTKLYKKDMTLRVNFFTINRFFFFFCLARGPNHQAFHNCKILFHVAHSYVQPYKNGGITTIPHPLAERTRDHFPLAKMGEFLEEYMLLQFLLHIYTAPQHLLELHQGQFDHLARL